METLCIYALFFSDLMCEEKCQPLGTLSLWFFSDLCSFFVFLSNLPT